jgi:hypothetical protein
MKGEKLNRDRPPKARRLQALGVSELQEGEVTRMIRVRGEKATLETFTKLPTTERGRVIAEGLKAIRVFAGENSKTRRNENAE